MASIWKTRSGAWQVQWIGTDGKRKTKTLKTRDRRAAERFGVRMEEEWELPADVPLPGSES